MILSITLDCSYSIGVRNKTVNGPRYPSLGTRGFDYISVPVSTPSTALLSMLLFSKSQDYFR